MATRMLQRRADAADWAALNPILSEGEIGFERDTKIFKFGDGVTPWNTLGTPYAPSNATVPVGGIVMFSGNTFNLPSNWRICDGTNGTPDLRNRFVVGAGGEYEQGDTGGAKDVALTTGQIPGHTHGAGTLANANGGGHSHDLSMVKHDASATHAHGSSARPSAQPSTGTLEVVQATNSGTISSQAAHSHTISGSTGSTGSGAAHENRPPYYALAYIMRMS